MPRRATPLSPSDGPRARFALALRQLRDEAGFDAKTIASIAAENHIPKSTLHAALRGERIPTVPVLAALVRAWGGDPTVWLKRRTQAEAEIECLGGPAERAGRAKATGPGPADRRREASTPSKSPSVTSQTRSPVHASDPHAYAREIARFPFPEALGAVKRAHRQGGSDELKAIVGRLRLAAGEPSQRRLARDLQLSSTAVSRVLQGTPKDDEELRLVLLWLLDTIRLNPPPSRPGRDRNQPAARVQAAATEPSTFSAGQA
ncbi:helix-turn-helix domain-containing protein [Streptomyces sp. NBC_00467]|uniref:helix-turn-helix domain-containing protein n=1 Tax=Streptomyces sp. NBC_00467 TaxID=2975752 RepID=UPI003FA6900B